MVEKPEADKPLEKAINKINKNQVKSTTLKFNTT